MVSSIALSIVSLYINKLKKSVSVRYGINWTEYLALVAINKFDKDYGFATATNVIAELDFNRDWVYGAINSLAEKNFISITRTGNPWIANNLNVTTGGQILLHYSERALKEMIEADEEINY